MATVQTHIISDSSAAASARGFSVSGPAAIVTGSAQGTGRELARQYAAAGARAAVADADRARAVKDTVRKLSRFEGSPQGREIE